ncbi:MAG: MBOAT family protein, partial [Eubacteriaceae bacterium]|nr:MBOAT family protein [Eubacteriaceae bacterium]
MLFSSSIFLFGFLPAVLLFYYIFFRRNRKWQNIFLTCVSLFFYAWGEPFFVLIMICSIIINWAFALWVDKVRADKTKAKYTLALMVAVNIGLLFVFKYLVFTIVNINRFLGADIIVPNIILPIGISFFTFQAMSYVIDVYRNAGKAQKNPLNVALYISFFPQLIAGPIVRYNTVAEQIINRKETFNDFSEGVCRFIIGLSKKILLANTLALVADKAFAAQSPSVALAWLGIFAYTFQIYFDCSGDSDMAIGLGK